MAVTHSVSVCEVDLRKADRYPLSARYDPDWLMRLEMGPHPLWQLESLLEDVTIDPGSRVLDLGCGMGATSVFLVHQCDVDVVALDLWVDEDRLRDTFEAAGVLDRVTPVNGTVEQLPFADGEFDAIVSIDAFEYFGTSTRLLPALLRVLERGGRIGMTTPGLRTDPYVLPPPAYVTDVVGWEAAGWHAPDWWATHWGLSGLVEDVSARMQPRGRDDWLDWQRALDDRDGAVLRMLEADVDDQIGISIVSATKV